MKKIYGILLLLTLITLVAIFYLLQQPKKEITAEPIWQIRSVDTVKYSRDRAREKSESPEFDKVIDTQVKNIAETGANYVAISTPYDAEFKPFLLRWVKAARENRLHIWYRGNFSGWEGWFEYPKIDRDTHLRLTEAFILENPELFEKGDIFTSCPECENGGPGDPRHNGDLKGHREFLIKEHQVMDSAFKKIGKEIPFGYYSMNYDVANLVMDAETTKQLGGIVVIDHYIKDPIKIASDAKQIADKTHGKVVLGEIGAPIPDIHGKMNNESQAEWVASVLKELSEIREVIGVNYWVNVGGTTQIWDADNNPKKAVSVLKSYFNLRRILE